MKREPAIGKRILNSQFFIPSSKRPAFTLIELLVVIAIIAILGGDAFARAFPCHRQGKVDPVQK